MYKCVKSATIVIVTCSSDGSKAVKGSLLVALSNSNLLFFHYSFPKAMVLNSQFLRPYLSVSSRYKKIMVKFHVYEAFPAST